MITSQSQHRLKLITGAPIKPIIKRSFRRVDLVDLGGRVSNIKLVQAEHQSVDIMLENWHSQMISIFDDVAPLKQFPWRRNKLPWLTDDIQDLIERRDGVLRHLKMPGICQQIKDDLAIDLKLLRKQVKSRIRRAVKDEGAAALAGRNHKDAWSFIKSATFTVKKCRESYLDSNSLNNYFASIVQCPFAD